MNENGKFLADWVVEVVQSIKLSAAVILLKL